MRKYTADEIKEILERHKRWLDESEGWSEDIIQGDEPARMVDYDDLAEAREDAVEGYKLSLASKLRSWAIEERDSEKYAHRKSHALLEDIAQKIENGEL